MLRGPRLRLLQHRAVQACSLGAARHREELQYAVLRLRRGLLGAHLRAATAAPAPATPAQTPASLVTPAARRCTHDISTTRRFLHQ
jgi:hypothetical protein